MGQKKTGDLSAKNENSLKNQLKTMIAENLVGRQEEQHQHSNIDLIQFSLYRNRYFI
jgi:hypothetical protein